MCDYSVFPADGGIIDRFDKYVSSWVFNLEFGRLDYPLSVVGMWFGIPIFAICLLPLLLVHLVLYASASVLFSSVVLLLGLLALSIWIYLIRTKQLMTVYAVKRDPLAALLVLAHALCSLVPGGLSLCCCYYSSYAFTQTFILAGKIAAHRKRPGLALANQLQRLVRYVPQATYLGKVGWTMFESFPSGDTAGSVVFCYVIYRATGCFEIFAFVMMAAFGRMYFWAHHFLDVVAGGGIAILTCYALETMVGPWSAFGPQHSVALTIFVIVGGKQVVKYRLPLPKHLDDGIEHFK